MKSSVTATERLKLVSMPRSALALMNSRMSGWSTLRMPMLAPRRRPPCFTTSVVVSKMRMKPTGPEATRPVERTWSPRGRRWVKVKPVPPPVWWIRAMSRTPSRMDCACRRPPG